MRPLTGAILTILLALPAAVAAQAVLDTKSILTWQAESYVPQGYRGKTLPTQGSFVTAAFELLEDGKSADLAKREMRWFLNDTLFAKGLGLKTARFQASVGADNSHFVRVQVTDGRNILFEKSVEISIVRPRVSILPLPAAGTLARGAHEFRAIPFFFNTKSIDEILFSWNVNGQTPSTEGVDEPFKLSFAVPTDTPLGTPLTLSVFTNSKKEPTEMVSKELRLVVR
ncbi:MAG: hypothetical protein Q8Q41_01820 [bacterium]|nr:hypothetical protein [bacterium]